MPSGPKKRRAAKRKNETKQNEEFTTVSVVKVTIPIEELAKGAVWHEATSVDKELDKAKNIIVQVPNEFKAQAKETDVSTKLIEGVDLNEVKNTIEEVSDNSNTVQENNEVDVTSNHEDILVSNDDPVLSTTTGCIMENVESSGISQENELISDVMKPEEIFERYHDLIYDNDNSILDYDKDRGFFFRDVPVVVPGVATDVEVLAANEADTVGKRDIGIVADVSVMDNVIEANEEPLLNVNTNDQDKEILKESQNSSCIVGSVESDVEPHEVNKDTAPLVSVNVMSNESIKEEENNVMIHDQSTEAVEGMNDAAQLVSELPVVFSPPSSNASSAENIELSDSNEMQALPTGAVSTATEDKVTEIPSNLNELLDVLQGTVPRATEKQVYFACPMHCNADCSFSQLLRDELLENVEELKIAIHSLKEDLEKTLDKLDSISY